MKQFKLTQVIKTLVKAFDANPELFGKDRSHAQKLDAAAKKLGFTNFKALPEDGLKTDSKPADSSWSEKVSKLGEFKEFDIHFLITDEDEPASLFTVSPTSLAIIAKFMDCAITTKQSLSYEAPCCEARNDESSRIYKSYRIAIGHNASLSSWLITYDKHANYQAGHYSSIQMDDLLSFIARHDRTKSEDLEDLGAFWLESKNSLYVYAEVPEDFSEVSDYLDSLDD